ncbi:hypothetical protein BRC90_09325 [Halobacteriales archaeon QS_4_69_34]|nr:MAG: hypothetical protein BRC90_09325 [Halobacteriales archaeon QS_4_69_34]
MTASRTSVRAAAVVLALVLFASLAAPAGAFEVEAEGVPAATPVGEDVSATFALDDLYTDAPEAWRLRATTELENVTWTVRAYGLAGEQLAVRSFDSSSFEMSVRADNDIASIDVAVEGTAPQVANFSYDPPQAFTLARFVRLREGGASVELNRTTVRHYTAESKRTRAVLDDARPPVGEMEGGEDDGESERAEQFGFAVSAYEHENFANARAIAGDLAAEERDGDRSIAVGSIAARTGQIVTLVLGVLVVLLGAGWLRSRRTGSGRGSDRFG